MDVEKLYPICKEPTFRDKSASALSEKVNDIVNFFSERD